MVSLYVLSVRAHRHAFWISRDYQWGKTQLVVVECLAPGDEGESGEGLGLELEGKVEVLGGFLGLDGAVG